MNIVRYRDPFDNVFDSMLRLMSLTNSTNDNNGVLPTQHGLDIFEKDGNLIVKAPLPGVDPKDISIELKGNILMISGFANKEEFEKEGKKVVYSSSMQKKFSYSTTLPQNVTDKTEAVCKDGICIIKIELAKEAQTKKISVKTN